jgi:O-antigen/teichoic acid export membrane protein
MSANRLKFNIVANYASSAWSALANLVFAPVFLAYLGVEAYGLIGTFILLQSCLALMDMGLGPALNRSMALFSAGGLKPQGIRDLLRSIEWIVIGPAIAVAVALWVASQWLGLNWLKVEYLPQSEVAQALAIMGLVLGLRLVENIYRSGLNGLQRQVELSLFTIFATTLRSAGAALVLIFVSPTISVFFQWQAFVALVSVAGTRALLYRHLPAGERPARFSADALGEVGRFAGGMLGITLLSLLLSQVDKFILLKLRPLTEYGYYALAVAAAGAILIPVGPITQALLPRMSAMMARGDETEVAALYHEASRFINALVASMAFVIIGFAEPILQIWTGNPVIASNVAPLLSVYVIGTMLNAVLTVPFLVQVAHGWTGLTLRFASIALVFSSLGLAWAIPRYGALGASWMWVALNLVNLLVTPIFMHRKLLTNEARIWYVQDVALPFAVAGSIVFGMRQLGQPTGVAASLAMVLVTALLALGATLLCVPSVNGAAVQAMVGFRRWCRRFAAGRANGL